MLNATLSYELLGPVILVAAGSAFLLLFLHDRKQLPALRLSGAYFLSLAGYLAVMQVDGEPQPATLAVILASLFCGHFLLVWGVSSLFGRDFPRWRFGFAVLLAGILILYASVSGPLFWLRFAAVSGFTVVVNLICCALVWKARSHRVDMIVASVFLIQAVLTVNRIVQVQLSEIDLTAHSVFKNSHFAPSMQTENAIFAIVIGLALFARNSVTLVMKLKHLAETDPLTGLLNRRAFEARAQALRSAAAPLPTGLIFCDIDHFKRVNDSHGHEMGDRALIAFARQLERETPDTAICARLGGEEFCVLVAGVNDETIRLQATHLRSAVEWLQIPTSTGRLGLTASFGYCRLDPGDDLQAAMASVDAAVYKAKSDGRNQVREAAPSAGNSGLVHIV
ncbi:diguanylate cyclase [Hoeflea sp. YIM 152468]|uniref:GGDEF domain-containing protein n=1 Tax=Hoeflea sp. YIM 152468 TaxID=3031759 RepID=UPI0023D9FB0F|nr:diguanylate cyclase [Hoeflea sp. YIM 152468]MDF1608110.1 diguanylate cyclase [Hoeflea sp. YIM 152468]